MRHVMQAVGWFVTLLLAFAMIVAAGAVLQDNWEQSHSGVNGFP